VNSKHPNPMKGGTRPLVGYDFRQLAEPNQNHTVALLGVVSILAAGANCGLGQAERYNMVRRSFGRFG
jgi:hypothetical protein